MKLHLCSSVRRPFGLLVASFVLGGISLQADNFLWAPNGTEPLGGAGTWDVTTPNWTAGAGSGYGLWPANGDLDRAVFAGTPGVVSVSGTVAAQGIRFESDGYTLQIPTGNTLNLRDGIGFAPGIQVPNAGQTVTINGRFVVDNPFQEMALAGRGTLVLTAPTPVVASGAEVDLAGITVKVMSANVSLDPFADFWLGDGTGDNSDPTGAEGTGGGATLMFDNSGATGAISQSIFRSNVRSGESSVQVHRVAAQNFFIDLGQQTRSPGASVNYVVTGGTNGTDVRLNISGAANGYLNQGSYFNGSSFAFKATGGFLRGINYGSDSSTTNSAGGATVAGTHVQTNGAITAQTTATYSSLKINGAHHFTLAGGATVTVSGILKAGNSAATISGGTAIRPGGSRDFVLRTDQAGDALTIGSVIQNSTSGASSLTKNGAGTLTLTGANTYTGVTYLTGGVLSVPTFPTAGGIASPVGQSGTGGSAAPIRFSGGTLQYTGPSVTTTRRFDVLTGGGGIEVTQAGTVFNLNSRIEGGNAPGFDELVKSGPGTLQISGTTDNSGLNAAVNGGILLLAKASSFSPDVHAVSSLTVNSGGTARLGGTGGDQIYDGPTIHVNTGGTFDLNGRDEMIAGLRGGGTITNDSAGGDSLLTVGFFASPSETHDFGGVITDGAGGHEMSLVKEGEGMQVLSGISTYTGDTTVFKGTLVVNGSISGSFATIVSPGATLAGMGAAGFTQVQDGGILAPGFGSTTGALTIDGGLNLDSGSTTQLQLGGVVRGSQYDAVDVIGLLRFGGDLAVSFANGFVPSGGEVFNLFDMGSREGTFDSILLPTLSGGLSWDTSQVYSTGEIAIAVPEPGGAALLVAGLSLVVAGRRRDPS